MAPRIELVGDGSEDYLPYALALHRQGKRGDTTIDGRAMIKLKDRLIRIVLSIPEFAMFRQFKYGGALHVAFSSSVDPCLQWGFGGDLPTITTYYPVYLEDFLAPAYNKIKFYDPGAATSYLEAMLLTPITSIHSEFLVWRGVTLTPKGEDGEAWIFLKYQLGGYLNQYDMPTYTKLITFDGATITSENTTDAKNVPAAVGFSRDGISYRRLKTGETEKIVLYGHDDAAYSGMLYDIVLNELGQFDIVPLPIVAPDPGTRTDLYDLFDSSLAYPGGRHVDNMLDIFTSAKAAHYYVVRFTADNMLWYFAGKPKWDNMLMFGGMSLVVEKMSKADDTLVETYNLTPSVVDHVLQGATYLQQCINTANTDTLAWMTFQEVGYEIFTRFVPLQGAVLVADDGTEFPILTIMSCSQDHFGLNGTSYGADSRRQNYVENGVIYVPPTQMNIFQQAGMLWLGTPPEGFDGYTWGGVDAVGLKITGAAAPGQVNDVAMASMRRSSSAISDSDRMVCELAPFTMPLMGFTAESNIITCTELFAASYSEDIDTTSGGVFLVKVGTEQYSYTVPTGVDILASVVAQSIADTINVSTVYHAATPVQSGNDFSITVTRIDIEDLTPVAMEVSYHSNKIGQSNERRLVSVALSGGVPTVTLEKVIPLAHSFFMFDM